MDRHNLVRHAPFPLSDISGFVEDEGEALDGIKGLEVVEGMV